MRDLHAEITARIVARLKEGVVPWRKPWTNGMPRNAVTGRPYSGVNILLLHMKAETCDYGSPCWLTFKQALEVGGNVRKGEHGEMVIFVSQITKAGDDDEERHRSFLKAYTVFNVAQCDGLPGKVTRGESGRRADPKKRDDLADAFLRTTGAVILHGGSRASYAGYDDCIRLPAFAWFESADLYYSTVFHELAHWAGNERRLKWDFAKRFGDSAYSVEELAAELTAAFLCGEFCFDTQGADAAYIAHWIQFLTDHDKAIVTAAAAASRAVELLRGLALADSPPLNAQVVHNMEAA